MYYTFSTCRKGHPGPPSLPGSSLDGVARARPGILPERATPRGGAAAPAHGGGSKAAGPERVQAPRVQGLREKGGTRSRNAGPKRSLTGACPYHLGLAPIFTIPRQPYHMLFRRASTTPCGGPRFLMHTEQAAFAAERTPSCLLCTCPGCGIIPSSRARFYDQAAPSTVLPPFPLPRSPYGLPFPPSLHAAAQPAVYSLLVAQLGIPRRPQIVHH